MEAIFIGVRDSRPKRRTSPDNPYTIFTTGTDSPHPRYYVEFVDGQGVKRHTEVNSDVFEVFDNGELMDIRQMNEVDRHISQSTEENGIFQQESDDSLDDMLINKEMVQVLYHAMKSLGAIQMRRVKMYFYENMTYEEIAAHEGCDFHQVRKSVLSAIKKIRKI